MTTPIDLAAIERAARAATIEAIQDAARESDGVVYLNSRRFDDTRHAHVQALQRVLDPATVLALVARARRAEELEAKLAAVESVDERARTRTRSKIEGRSLGD